MLKQFNPVSPSGCCYRARRRGTDPPAWASADVDAIARQLPAHQEEEGWGPIVVKAAEQHNNDV
jgi:hypothetical protein